MTSIIKSQKLLTTTDLAELRQQAGQLLSHSHSAHKLDSRDAGWLPTNTLGSGMDYAESRVYQHGDDPRTINWRLSARSTETFVKTYQMEARPNLCIVLDQRRSMIFGTRKRLKITQALRVATILAIAAEQHRLKLQIILLGDENQWLEGQDLDELLSKANQLEMPPAPKTQASMKDVLNQLNQTLATGSLLYLISDFLDLEPTDSQLLAQLEQRCYVQAVHIMDSAEQKMCKTGGVCLQNMFGDAFLSLNDHSADELQAILQKQLDQVRQLLQKSALDYAPIIASADILHDQLRLPLGH